jgi:hypothetical protein
MKKIKNLFERVDREIINKIRPSSQWVADGEGIATAKFDGTCCLVKDCKLYARYDLKPHKSKLKKPFLGEEDYFIKNPYVREDFKIPPKGFIECDDSDMYIGHIMGWIPVEGNEKFYPHHVDGFEYASRRLENGTYELVGPKVQGNPYILKNHKLWRHGAIRYDGTEYIPRDFEGLKEYLLDPTFEWEGIVWHRYNGDMVKIRVRDFKNLTDE